MSWAGRMIANAQTSNDDDVRDANGNRTHENGQAIASYDSQDRLITWKGATYQYNGAGDLSKKNQCRRRHHLQLRGIEHAKVRASPYSRQFVA